MKVKCTTLFDITKTELSNRRKHLSDTISGELLKQRSQQINLETLLQVIGLRCQPEHITDPKCIEDIAIYWGKIYNTEKIKMWHFTFVIEHSATFLLDGDILGNLKVDCIGVPMITGLDESVELSKTLDLSSEYKNIHFEVLNE